MKLIVVSFLSLVVILAACTNKQLESETITTSQKLFEEIVSTKNYSFYQGDSTVTASSPESAHNAFFRLRFNSIAAAALTEAGKLPSNGVFPEGSIIVKDLYDSQTGKIVLFAVMKKESSNNNNKGWLWAEYDSVGKDVYPLSSKGSGCVSCHSTNQRDYVRLFDLF